MLVIKQQENQIISLLHKFDKIQLIYQNYVHQLYIRQLQKIYIYVIEKKKQMSLLQIFLLLIYKLHYANADWVYKNQIPITYAGASIRDIKVNTDYISINFFGTSGYALSNIRPVLQAPYYQNVTFFQLDDFFQYFLSTTSADSNRYLYHVSTSSCFQSNNPTHKIVYTPGAGFAIKYCEYLSNFDVAVVLVNSGQNQVTLIYIRNYTVLYTKPPITIVASQILKCGPLTDLIFLVNQTAINLYSTDTNFTLFKSLPYSPANYSFVCDNKKDYFLYSLDSQNYYLINKTNNFSIVYQGFSAGPIKRLQISYPYYILITDKTQAFWQIDCEINQVIFQSSTIQASNIVLPFDLQNSSYFIFGNYSSNYLEVYASKNEYLCTGSCVSCFNTYVFNPLTQICAKTLQAQQPQPQQQQQQPVLSNNQDSKQTWFQTLLNFVGDNLGIPLQMTSNKIFTRGSVYFIIFVDDLELYQYHQVEYSQALQIAIQKPKFLTGFFNSTVQYFQNQDQIYQNLLPALQKQPDDYYFLCSTQSIYIGSFALNAIQFVCTKFVYFLFLLLNKKCGLFKNFTNWLGQNTRWWVLLLMFIESNMIYLSFDFFLQLTQPLNVSFTFFNKLNIVIAILSFYLFLLYAFCFYLMLKYFSKKQAKIVLNNQARPASQGYLCESFCRIVRNLSRAFFHSFYLDNYKVQIIGLACVGFLTTACLLMFRKSYKRTIVYWLFFAYHLTFFLFDVTLALHYLHPQYFYNVDYDLVNQIILYALFSLMTCLILLQIVTLLLFLIVKIKKWILSSLLKRQQLNQKNKKKNTNTVEYLQRMDTSNQVQSKNDSRYAKNKKIHDFFDQKQKLKNQNVIFVAVTTNRNGKKKISFKLNFIKQGKKQHRSQSTEPLRKKAKVAR